MTTQTETSQAANDATAPGAASTGSELDSLLKEFKEGTKASENANITKVLEAFKPVADYVAGEAQSKQEQRLETDVKEAVAYVRKESGASDEFPERFVRGFLRDLVADSQEASEAWVNRHKAPEKWKAVLVKGKDEFAAELKKLPASREPSDVERAMASLRNVSTSPNEAPKVDPVKLMAMNDREYENFKRSVGL